MTSASLCWDVGLKKPDPYYSPCKMPLCYGPYALQKNPNSLLDK